MKHLLADKTRLEPIPRPRNQRRVLTITPFICQRNSKILSFNSVSGLALSRSASFSLDVHCYSRLIVLGSLASFRCLSPYPQHKDRTILHILYFFFDLFWKFER